MNSEILTIGGDDEPAKPTVSVVGGLARLAATLATEQPVPEPGVPLAPPVFQQQAADDVEYDIVLPGGGKETVQAGHLEGALDTVALAQRRLLQMKTLRMLLKKAKKNKLNAAWQANRTKKSRKKRELQKASRKRNRG